MITNQVILKNKSNVSRMFCKNMVKIKHDVEINKFEWLEVYTLVGLFDLCCMGTSSWIIVKSITSKFKALTTSKIDS